jgi:hypothetical protein
MHFLILQWDYQSTRYLRSLLTLYEGHVSGAHFFRQLSKQVPFKKLVFRILFSSSCPSFSLASQQNCKSATMYVRALLTLEPQNIVRGASLSCAVPQATEQEAASFEQAFSYFLIGLRKRDKGPARSVDARATVHAVRGARLGRAVPAAAEQEGAPAVQGRVLAALVRAVERSGRHRSPGSCAQGRVYLKYLVSWERMSP